MVEIYSASAAVLASGLLGAGVRLALHPQFLAGLVLLSVGFLVKLSRAWVGVLLLVVLLVTCISIFAVASDRIVLLVRKWSPFASRAISKSTVFVAGSAWSLATQAAPWTITLLIAALPAVTQMAGSFSTVRLLMASKDPRTQLPSAPSLVVTVLVYVFGVKLFGLSRTWLQPSKIAFLLQSFWVARMLVSPATYIGIHEDARAIKYLPSVLVGWGGFMLSLMPEGAIMGAIQSGASSAALAGAAVASVASLNGLKSMSRRRRHGRQREVHTSEERTSTIYEQHESHQHTSIRRDSSNTNFNNVVDGNELLGHSHSDDGSGAATALICASWQQTKTSWSEWLYGRVWMWMWLKEWGLWVADMLRGKGGLRTEEKRESARRSSSSSRHSKDKEEERKSRTTSSGHGSSSSRSSRSSRRSKSASRRSEQQQQQHNLEDEEEEMWKQAERESSDSESQQDTTEQNKSRGGSFPENLENTDSSSSSNSRKSSPTEDTGNRHVKQPRSISKLIARAVAKGGVVPADLSPPVDAAFGVVLLRSFPTAVVIVVASLSVIIGSMVGENELGARSFIPLMLTPFAFAELFLFWSKFVLVYGHPLENNGSWRTMLPSMFMMDMSMPSKEELQLRFPDGMSLLLWEHPKLSHAWRGLLSLSKDDPDSPTGNRGEWMLRAISNPATTAKAVLGSSNALLLSGDVELTRQIYLKLVFSIILDLMGVATFALPGIGEAADVFFAPFSAFALQKMYGSSAISWFGFFEELLPFTDIIPTATLSWLYFYGPSLVRYLGRQVRTRVSSSL